MKYFFYFIIILTVYIIFLVEMEKEIDKFLELPKKLKTLIVDYFRSKIIYGKPGKTKTKKTLNNL